MKFREWFVKEVNSGLQRHFHNYAQMQVPGQHPYAIKQALDNRVTSLYNRSKLGTVRTPQLDRTVSMNGDDDEYQSLSQLYQDPRVREIANRKWVEQVIEVSPIDFDSKTQNSFIIHEFGFSKRLSTGVRDHDNRMAAQQAKADSTPMDGTNEPIMVILSNGKYKLVEGWHRMFSYLLAHSATPEDRQLIQNGQSRHVNFQNWRRIKIKALVANEEQVSHISQGVSQGQNPTDPFSPTITYGQ